MKSREWMRQNSLAFTFAAVMLMGAGVCAGAQGIFGMGFGVFITTWVTYWDYVKGKDIETPRDNPQDERFREWVEKERARIDASKKI